MNWSARKTVLKDLPERPIYMICLIGTFTRPALFPFYINWIAWKTILQELPERPFYKTCLISPFTRTAQFPVYWNWNTWKTRLPDLPISLFYKTCLIARLPELNCLNDPSTPARPSLLSCQIYLKNNLYSEILYYLSGDLKKRKWKKKMVYNKVEWKSFYILLGA